MNAINPSELWKKRLGDWVVNPYVGCEHGCKFCYCPAMPGVKFFNEGRAQSEWGSYLIPKVGIVEALERQLKTFTPAKAKRTEWGDGWVLMSFLTDCYTPAEAKLGLTRACLQRLLEAGHKVRIQTRSALVERDFDLLEKHKAQVRLGTSLPHLDDALARILEPRATGPTRRLKMLEKAAGRGIPVYVAVAPVIRFSGWQKTILRLSDAGLDFTEVFCEVLNPKGANLAMMVQAMRDAGHPPDAVGERRGHLEWVAFQLHHYDATRWAESTLEVLMYGAEVFGKKFVPWPDTGRGWAKHLPAFDVDWLDQFLPPKPTPKATGCKPVPRSGPAPAPCDLPVAATGSEVAS